MGHEVRIVYTGIDAVEAAIGFKPEFAFLDIGLPGLNGNELARRLRGASHDEAHHIGCDHGMGTGRGQTARI